ncbi:MAG: protein-disulfide reductase DsbD family protein, partial [Casimicrobiaceae bacterium]
MTRNLRWFAAALAVAFAPVAWAAPVKTAHVAAELVAEDTALVPGTTAMLALRLDIAPGWHTYWRNPGESGLPTTLAWHLPRGYSAGSIEWPAPRRLPVGRLVNYGYEGEVFHLVPLAVPAMAGIGSTAVLAARADWLVCKETCIPEGADLTLALPVAREATKDPRWARPIRDARAELPHPLPAGWIATAAASGPTITLHLQPVAGASDPGALGFFASDPGRIEPSSPQVETREQDGSYVIRLPVSHELEGAFTRLAGVLTAERGWPAGRGATKAIVLDIAVTGNATPGPNPLRTSSGVSFATGDRAPSSGGIPASASRADGDGQLSDLSLPLALAFGFVGGLLLNFMPCVFPVLSLKALALAAVAAGNRSDARREGVAFALGVVITFVAFGAAITGLRAAGEELGWGFQLQSPAFVASLAILFFVLALNLSGVFEFASLVPGRAVAWSSSNRNLNAFGSGVLVVAIASPCTAPFMGAALGYALAGSASVMLAVFAVLGIGMALPYAVLAWFPQWRRVLPRPGAWLVRLKQFFAFPLYATVAWLVWVLGAQIGNDAVIRIGIVLVLVAFALWAWRGSRVGAHRAWSAVAVAGAIAGSIVAWPLFADGQAPPAVSPARAIAANGPHAWQNWSTERVVSLVDQGRPVFVDFTAAWCITCQLNERLVLDDARVRDAFARSGVALLRADWTRRDPAITEALARLGRSGVPAYVLYR